jgi:outer membrane receptor protein involved in Fe transport
MKSFLFILLVCWVSFLNSFGQGTVRGKVTDDNGEALIGATIMMKLKSTTGVVTDYDGNFSLKITEKAPQPIVISYIGYQSVEDTVNPGKNEVVIRNYKLIPASSQIGEVKVIAKGARSKDTYMAQIKMKSLSSLDYISSDIIKRTGDVNVTAAVSRIAGVSTYGGFITVRGIGDRYVKTTINGSRIPTLDPFTNNIKLDLFPASLIDNITVTKTYTADLPGDWAGAYLDIETKEYPEKLTISIETSAGYNTQSTFRNVVSATRSSSDWLGFDNARNINHLDPVGYNEGFQTYSYDEFAALGLGQYLNSQGISQSTTWTDTYTRLSLIQLGFLGEAQMYDDDAYISAKNAYEASELKQEAIRQVTSGVIKIGKSLPNTWLTTKRNVPVDFSQSFSIGNQTRFLGRTLGYLVGFRYSRSVTYDNNGFFGRTKRTEVNDTIKNLDNLYDDWGYYQTSTETNGWSALVNLAYKINTNNSLSFLFMPNLIGTNKARISSQGYDFEVSQFYESRQQLVYQAKTEHYVPALKVKIESHASYTKGFSNAPDYRHLVYSIYPLRLGSGEYDNSCFRMFSDLSEDLFDSHISVEIPLSNGSELARKIKFGAAFQKLIRKTEQHYYYIPTRAAENISVNGSANIDSVMNINSFGTIMENNNELMLYYVEESGPMYNTIGFSKNLAGFAMIDYSLTQALRLYAGLRVEDSHLHTDIDYYYQMQYSVTDERRYNVKPAIRDNYFYLPSASMLCQLKHDAQFPVNLRLNFSKTMALPSLREITPYKLYDYSLMGVVIGNAGLKPANVYNYDLRFEAYLKSGNNFSISLFYKKFDNHIEMIRDVSDRTYLTWQNTKNSKVIGIEMECRIGLTRNMEFRANAILVNSSTTLKKPSSTQYTTRTMYGQAPYVINAILSYNTEKYGISATINYNVQGPKLVLSGNFGAPDVYELPRNIIDAKLSKTMGKKFSASLKIRDLLNTANVKAYKYPNRWLDYERYDYGTSYSLAISYNLK